jgi:aspartate racemase
MHTGCSRDASCPPSARQRALPGILGGMGPHAMLEFERALVDEGVTRGARRDQEHLQWIAFNACAIPDRTRALAGDRIACRDALVEAARRLERAGADFLVVPCNTAHAFRDEVTAAVGIPWIDLIGAGADACASFDHVAVFATLGTARERLYERAMRARGRTPLIPDPDGTIQADVSFAIEDETDGVKATGTTVSPAALTALRRVVAWAHAQGADAVLAGCTELSVGFARVGDASLPVVDPLRSYAKITFDRAFPAVDDTLALTV